MQSFDTFVALLKIIFAPPQFASRKIGDGEVSNTFRERLERELDDLQFSLKQRNEVNKPPEPEPEPAQIKHKKKKNKIGLFIAQGLVSLINGFSGASGGGSSTQDSTEESD